MISTLPYGRYNPHINESCGPDTDITKRYVTQNGSEHGAIWKDFVGKPTRHKGTGYASNIRPQIFYKRTLDELDNPFMAKVCSKNYHTETELQYQPYANPSGRETLPAGLVNGDSGFVRDKAIHAGKLADVRSKFFDTRLAGAPTDFLPRYKPHLHKIQSKDPVETENFDHGPKFMSTENKAQFSDPMTKKDSVNLHHGALGKQEKSGASHNRPIIEPIQHRFDSAHRNDVPRYVTGRPTGHSIYTNDFLPFGFLHGNERLPNINESAEKESAITRENMDSLPPYIDKEAPAFTKVTDLTKYELDRIARHNPAELLNVLHPHNHNSIHRTTFGDPQRSRTQLEALGRRHIGLQERTGHVANNDSYCFGGDDRHFSTEYTTRYTDRTLVGKDREGHLDKRGAQDPMESGFTLSEGLHSLGKPINAQNIIRSMEPYQARSLKARDPFYVDHTHDAKLRSTKSAIAADAH